MDSSPAYMGVAFVLKCPGSAASHLLLDTFLEKKKRDQEISLEEQC